LIEKEILRSKLLQNPTHVSHISFEISFITTTTMGAGQLRYQILGSPLSPVLTMEKVGGRARDGTECQTNLYSR